MPDAPLTPDDLDVLHAADPGTAAVRLFGRLVYQPVPAGPHPAEYAPGRAAQTGRRQAELDALGAPHLLEQVLVALDQQLSEPGALARLAGQAHGGYEALTQLAMDLARHLPSPRWAVFGRLAKVEITLAGLEREDLTPEAATMLLEETDNPVVLGALLCRLPASDALVVEWAQRVSYGLLGGRHPHLMLQRSGGRLAVNGPAAFTALWRRPGLPDAAIEHVLPAARGRPFWTVARADWPALSLQILHLAEQSTGIRAALSSPPAPVPYLLGHLLRGGAATEMVPVGRVLRAWSAHVSATDLETWLATPGMAGPLDRDDLTHLLHTLPREARLVLVAHLGRQAARGARPAPPLARSP